MLRENPARFVVNLKLTLFLFFLSALPGTDVTTEISRDFAAHIGGVVRLAFSPDSSQLVSVRYNGRAKTWDESRTIERPVSLGYQRCFHSSDRRSGSVIASRHRGVS